MHTNRYYKFIHKKSNHPMTSSICLEVLKRSKGQGLLFFLVLIPSLTPSSSRPIYAFAGGFPPPLTHAHSGPSLLNTSLTPLFTPSSSPTIGLYPSLLFALSIE